MKDIFHDLWNKETSTFQTKKNQHSTFDKTIDQYILLKKKFLEHISFKLRLMKPQKKSHEKKNLVLHPKKSILFYRQKNFCWVY